jgi:alpha-1,3-rhamnosyl/mannosyltransferase
MRRPPHIKVDATVLSNNVLTGVAHYTLGMVRGFDELASEGKLTYSLITPWRRSKNIHKLGLKHYKRIIKIPIPEKYLNGLRYFHIPAPTDLLFGPGNYYFPHYRSWPTWFSHSAVVIHDMAYEVFPETINTKHRRFLLRMVPPSVKHARAVLTPSNFSKSEAERYLHLPGSKVIAAPPAVDTEFFYRRSAKEIHAVKAKYEIFYDHYIMTLNNIEPRKNYVRLIDAYEALPKTIREAYPLFIVGGDGWNNQEILDRIQKAKERGCRIIRPRAFVPDEDLPALYSGASLYISVPLYEGFNMSPLEANACGVPAVVSNVASLPQAAGGAGIYVDPYSVKDINAAIEKTIRELKRDRHQYDKRMAEHVANFSSWRASAVTTAVALTGRPPEYFQSGTRRHA